MPVLAGRKRGSPPPLMTGAVEIRYSSSRPAAARASVSRPVPQMRRSPPSACFVCYLVEQVGAWDDHGWIPRRGVDRLGGDDVLGDRVDVVGEGVTGPGGPGLCHAFVGDAAEQQCVGGERHLQLVVLQLLVGVLERPLVRVVDVAVEGGVGEVDDLAHDRFLLVGGGGRERVLQAGRRRCARSTTSPNGTGPSGPMTVVSGRVGVVLGSCVMRCIVGVPVRWSKDACPTISATRCRRPSAH